MVELKACPCCRSEAMQPEHKDAPVYCSNRKCGLRAIDTERWNTRPTATDVGALIEQRLLGDTSRLLWKDEMSGICPSVDMCFEYSDRVRCGPCAIRQAEAKGVVPDMSLPALPEVSRLTREAAEAAATLTTLQARVDALEVENAGLRPKQVPTTVTHYCKHEPDGCTSHNLHCQWPACAAPRTGAAT